jgi:LPXTG-motif cell wall-anchored protein
VDCTPNTNGTNPTTTTTTVVGQGGPTSTVDQSSGAATTTTTDPIGGTLPATGNGDRTVNLTVIALTLIGIGAVMLRLSSKSTR